MLIRPVALASLTAHAAAGFPAEVCGLLVGELGADGSRIACEAWPLENAWDRGGDLRSETVQALTAAGSAGTGDWEAHDSRRRFLVDPRDVLQAMKRARAAGRELVGVYHSHPDHPAVPSEFDRQAAVPDWSYVIVNVSSDGTGECRCWELTPEGDRFLEEALLEASDA